MKFIITSLARAQGFLDLPTTRSVIRTERMQILFGIGEIGNKDWKEIVVTLDVKEEFEQLMKKIGTEFIPDQGFHIHTEDDLPPIEEMDKVIVMNGNGTITSASTMQVCPA